MASILKKPTSRFWFAAFRDIKGTQHRRSTQETDRKKALKIAEQFEAVAQRRLPANKVRETISELYREIYQEALPTSSVRQYTEQWLASKEAVVAPGTLVRYRETTRKFLAFLGPLADHDLSIVTRKLLVEFRASLATQLAPGTINLMLRTIRQVFKAARRDSYIVENPAQDLEPVKNVEKDSRRPFTLPELEAVLAVADPEWQSLIKCGLYTGLRLIDLASLTWDNVDLASNKIRLQIRKTSKRAIIPIGPALRKHLESLPSSDTPGAPLHERAFAILGNQGRSSTLSIQFGRLLAQAGLRQQLPRSQGKGRETRREKNQLTFHCLRHTTVSLLKDAGIPLATVMELVGHSSEQMSAHYTHVGDSSMEQAAAVLPEIGS
jgi:integrase